jgi:hypothetical protein
MGKVVMDTMGTSETGNVGRLRRVALFAAGLAVLSTVAAACQVFGVRGSGEMITETRDVSGFTEVALQGSGTVTVEVTGTESLTIEAEDNLMPLLTSDVDGGRLELGAERGISPTQEITYAVTAVSLEGVSISGSGALNAADIAAGTFAAEISGSGDVTLRGMDMGELVVRIGGSGEIEIDGTADEIDVSISGSGSYFGEDLVSTAGRVDVSGSGDAVVNVTDRLEANVSGSGTIEYLGDPSIESTVSGSGDISGR